MSAAYKILVLNGPNLGVLGVRQPEIYGSEGIDAVPGMVMDLLGNSFSRISLDFDQLNGEGALIDRLETAKRENVAGIAFNAGAYTHTSLAIADCLAWIRIPTVEVHLSNVWARPETVRHQSYMASHVIGVVAGFGIMSYALAVQALYRHLESGGRK
ncbi:MAG: 3-dehydroquinate dehydratase [Desulfovibrio sp.]